MPKFIYKAKKGPDKIIDGTIEADNFDVAVDKIVKLGYFPTDVSLEARKDQEPPVLKRIKNVPFSPIRRIGFSEVGIFLRQLADLMNAGVPILQALGIVVNQTKNPSLKDAVSQMQIFVKDGGTFSEALAQRPDIFSVLYVNMVKAGEMAGNLDAVLSRLSDLTDKELETRAKVSASLIYPALMLLVGILTVFVLLTFVIPRLTVMLEDLTETLPLPTLILVGISNFFARFWWAICAVVGFGILYFNKFRNSPEGRLWFDRFKLTIPVFGKFIEDVNIGRFARTLGTLLDSGVTIVSALESVWAVMDNEILKGEIQNVSREVASGSSLTGALQKCPHFPEVAVNMIAVGEESGRLEQSLYKLADSYEKRSDRTVKTITSLLEPLMIIFIGSIVGFIVMAMLLPIFKINLIIK